MKELYDNYKHIFEKTLLDEIANVGHSIYKEEGQVLIDIGSYIKGIPLILSGAIKVIRQDKNDDELLLYYLEKGSTCSMTTTCCLGHSKSEIRAITETDTTLIMIPVMYMEIWMTNYKTWRNFIINSYHNRLNEMLFAIDSIAFENLDERLIVYLKNKSRITNSQILETTHQHIANELNSSRVVISRLLKKLEKKGYIEVKRNSIRIFKQD